MCHVEFGSVKGAPSTTTTGASKVTITTTAVRGEKSSALLIFWPSIAGTEATIT